MKWKNIFSEKFFFSRTFLKRLVKGKEGEQVEEGAEDVRPADNGGNRFTVNRMGGKEGGSEQG